jgi:hypothetical protein
MTGEEWAKVFEAGQQAARDAVRWAWKPRQTGYGMTDESRH